MRGIRGDKKVDMQPEALLVKKRIYEAIDNENDEAFLWWIYLYILKILNNKEVVMGEIGEKTEDST